MFIKNIELHNFRNYENQKIDLVNGINIFYGQNAHGKTNIIESVYMCSIGKSHRGSKDNEMIMWDNNEGYIKISFNKEYIDKSIDIILRKNVNKQIKVNKKLISRRSELIGNLNSVIFSPDHMKIIKEAPAERRRFIDIIISQTNNKYFYNLTQYNKVIEQRNKLLLSIKKENSDAKLLDIWDFQLIDFGKYIIEQRILFINEINSIIKDIHHDITSNIEDIEIIYRKNCDENELEKKLLDERNNDIRRGYTNKGPHKDDILILINKKDVKVYGSQGQQRTSLLSLKLSELEYIKKKTGENPILLLDDVFSELDESRQFFLLKYIENMQSIITCTDIEYAKKKDMKNVDFKKVEKGKIIGG